MEDFFSEIGRFRRRWQRGLLRGVMFELLGWSTASLAVLCGLDYFLALAPAVRIILGSVCLVGLLVWFGLRMIRILRLSVKKSAVYADLLLENPRREILSALEIGTRQTQHSPLAAYLAQKEIKAAGKRLAKLRSVRLDGMPAALRKRLIIALAVSLLPALFNPEAAATLARRYVLPLADIAPYSPYVFKISPEVPQVIYGADQVIKVSISGAPVHHPVRFATRKGGQILESPCFQAGPQDFVQRLDRVMQPLEFCFRVGKARSAWHSVQVLYQPHVVAAHFRLIPPAYTQKPEKRFTLGTESLKGLKGTQVEITLQSNRPLKRGEIVIAPTDSRAHKRTVNGEITAPNELTFRWEMAAQAQLSLMFYDILETPAKEPLILRQELLADDKPAVSLIQPLVFSLATPGIKVPVEAILEDDIGIRRCDFFRGLQGYRSRAVPIEIMPGSATRDIAFELDLASLGVVPGDVIELFLEAADTNPDLTGSNASDIARLKIISDAEYAKMVRSKTTIEVFANRFRNLADHYDTLLKRLKDTAAELQDGRLGPEETAERTDRLYAEIAAVAQAVQALADDYAAFDLEKKLAQTAADVAQNLKKVLEHKGWTASAPNERLAAIADAHAQLNQSAAQNRTLQKDAREVAAVGQVMAMGAWYRSLLDRQKVHVSRLGQYAMVDRKGFAAAPLAEKQAFIRTDLIALADKLAFHAKRLPPGYSALQASSQEFVQKLRSAAIPVPMRASEKACRNEQPRQAWNYAGEALEKMEGVLRSCQLKCFSQICSGEVAFKVPDPLHQTMAQMLESLMHQYRNGVGWGTGTGAAGVGVAGAWEGSYLNGYSAFNVPVYGPERKNPFASEATANNADGQGRRSKIPR